MTLPQGNASADPIDTHRVTVQQYIEQVPLLLDAQGRGREKLRRFVVYLASFAGPDGSDIFPSVDRVALWMNVSRRTVFRLYREAEERKLIIREGHSSRGTIRVSLNLEYPFEQGWLPARLVADDRRKRAAARKAKSRAGLAGGDICPVTTTEGGDICPVTSASGHGANVTQPSIPEHHEEQPHSSTDAAGATPAGRDVIDAELIEEPSTAVAVVGRPATAAELAVPNLSDHWVSEWNSPRKPKSMPRWDPALWPLPAASKTATEWLKALVDVWYQRMLAGKRAPSGAECGQVQGQIHGLVAAGNNPNHIAAACIEAADRASANIKVSMDRVKPGFWASQRKGRSIATPDGVQQLPQGIGRHEARHLSIMSYATS